MSHFKHLNKKKTLFRPIYAYFWDANFELQNEAFFPECYKKNISVQKVTCRKKSNEFPKNHFFTKRVWNRLNPVKDSFKPLIEPYWQFIVFHQKQWLWAEKWHRKNKRRFDRKKNSSNTWNGINSAENKFAPKNEPLTAILIFSGVLKHFCRIWQKKSL